MLNFLVIDPNDTVKKLPTVLRASQIFTMTKFNPPFTVADFWEPIPLTPEVLEKCGFEKVSLDNGGQNLDCDFEKSYITMPFSRKRLILSFDDNGPGQINTYWVEDVGMGDVSLTFDIQSLHQLQNLYFALFSEELQVKL